MTSRMMWLGKLNLAFLFAVFLSCVSVLTTESSSARAATTELVTQYQNGGTAVFCSSPKIFDQTVTFAGAGTFNVSVNISSYSGYTPNQFIVSLGGTPILTVNNETALTTSPAFHSANGSVAAAGTQTLRISVCDDPSTIGWTDFSLLFTPEPSVTSIAPTTGPTAGGTTVVITGSDFTGTTAVKFGSSAASSFTVNSDTQITATAPAGSAGVVDVTVTTAGGTSSTSTADRFTYYAPLYAVQSVSSATVTAGFAVPAFTPAVSAGGLAPVTYAISPALPSGLSFNTSTGQVTGTPTALLPATTITVTLTDSASQTALNTFQLTVNPAPLFTAQAVPSTTLTAGSAATPFSPVTASGGFGTKSFAISPALPGGLSFDTSTGQITGTPTVLLATTTFTVTATDSTTPTAQTSSKTFQLTVNPTPLTTSNFAVAVGLTANSSIATITPVTASGGFGTKSFAISPALPAGLSFDTSTGQITGTPTVLLATTAFTVTVTDSTAPTAQVSSKTFNLTVSALVLQTVQAVPATTLTAGSATTPFTPVTASGGFGTISYAVSPVLPAGLSFDTSTGQVSGTPTGLLAATSFTVTVTDSTTPTAQTSSKTFELTVNPPSLSTAQAVPSTTLTAGSAATPFTPVTASGGFGTISYAVSPVLPAGLSFDTSTGQVSGTPTGLLAATSFTMTATDSTTPTAQTSSKTFELTVNPPSLSTAQAVPATTLTAGSAATPFIPVTASGGFGTISYAVSPALPTGLSFDTSTGQVSGTPTSSLASATFTVTATDSTTPTAQTSSQTFAITIAPAASATSLTASNTAPAIGQTVTLTATVTPGTATGTMTFSDGANTLCASVPLSAGSASCTASFAAAGSHPLVASYGGSGSLAASSATLDLSVSDQGQATAEAIGGFLSDRANQIVSNQFDAGRQIDRLQQAGQQQDGGDSSQLAVAHGKGDLGSQSLAQSSRLMSSRLGAGPDASAFSAAGQQASAAQDPLGVQSMLYGYLSNSAASKEYGQFHFSGPFEASANITNGITGSFKASLSQMMSWGAQQEAALGYGGSSAGSTYMPLDVWAEGVYSSYGGERDGRFGMLTIGTDYVFNPSFLLGFYGQYDNSKQTSGTIIEGQGWMVGSYATARLGQDVFWQGKAAWGRSSNDIESSGSGSFDSTRWLASSSLVGRWQIENGIAFSPALSFIYFEDKAERYVDSLGAAIPGVTTKLGQFKLTPEIAYGFALADGTWVEPSLSPELLWNFASTHMDGLGSLNSDAAGPEGLRGRVKVGLTIRTPSGISFAGSGSYDGIVASGYHSISGQGQVSIPLN